MKIFFILALLLFVNTNVYAKVQYAKTTLLTYANSTGIKVTGKIFPTAPLEILKVENGKALVKLSGWNWGKAERVIYYAAGKRIMSVAFKKNLQPEIVKFETLIPKGSKKTWTKVSLTTWIKNENIVDDLKPLYIKAEKFIRIDCGECHDYHKPEKYSIKRWPMIILGMGVRTHLSKEDMWLAIEYAQKHAIK